MELLETLKKVLFVLFIGVVISCTQPITGSDDDDEVTSGVLKINITNESDITPAKYTIKLTAKDGKAKTYFSNGAEKSIPNLAFGTYNIEVIALNSENEDIGSAAEDGINFTKDAQSIDIVVSIKGESTICEVTVDCDIDDVVTKVVISATAKGLDAVEKTVTYTKGEKILIDGLSDGEWTIKFSFTDDSGKEYFTATSTVSIDATVQNTVSIDEVEQVTVTPVIFSIPGGVLAPDTKLALSNNTTGAVIYYTIDGTEPTNKSTKYTTEIVLTESCDIKAVAYKTNMEESSISTESYEVSDKITPSPVFSQKSGTYTDSVTLKITNTLSTAKIYYTTDGSVPKTTSTLYAGEIVITEIGDTTVKAIAVADGKTNSPVVTNTYTIKSSDDLSTPVISPASGTFDNEVTVTISSKDSGVKIYYTKDGSTPDSSDTLYTAPFKLSTEGTYDVVAIATKDGSTYSKTIKASYVIKNKDTVAPPVFSPAAGTYTDKVSITLTTATSGASIYYTTDSSTPDAGSSLYKSSFDVTKTTTIKAIALMSDNTLANSAVTEAVYTITSNPVASPVILPTETDHKGSVAVTISTTTTNADIYYTLDGSTPTTGSTKYSTGFTITTVGDTTVKAIACKGTEKSSVTTKTFTITSDSFDGIKILVATSLGYDQIHYWSCSDAGTYPNTSWPGTKMTANGSDYVFDFNGASSVKLLITKDLSGNKLCSTDISITEKGTYRVTSSGAKKEENLDPTKPIVTISPDGGSCTGTTTITITISNGGAALTVKSATFGSKSVTVGEGSTTVTLSDYVANKATATLTVIATNSKGTTTVNKDFTRDDTDFNSLRLYQVMVGTFLDGDGKENFPEIWGNGDVYGDLDGVIKAIDYIKSLGMNAIWLTPIFESDGDSKLDATGYFCKDYFNVDDNWGGNSKFEELVTAAHKANLYVILDGVFGHHKGSVKASPNGRTPTGGSDPVSYPGSLDFYKEVATYWIEKYKIDGWRLDQAYQVATGPHDGKNFQDKNYWVDIRKAVEEACAKNKNEPWGKLGYMVGEIWDGGGESILKNGYTGYNGEKGLLSCFDFPGRYKLVQTLAVEESKKGNNGDASALNGVFSTPDKTSGVYPNMFITNHDVLRLGDLIQRGGKDEYWKRYKSAMSFLAAYTGPITVYYGDEWGAETEGYVNNGDGGKYDDNCSRSTGKISGFNTDQQSMIDYTKKIMNIRASHPALWRGSRRNLVANGQQYADLKTDAKTGEKIVYLLNTKTGSTTINISGAGSSFTDLETNAAVNSSSITLDGLTAKFLLVK